MNYKGNSKTVLTLYKRGVGSNWENVAFLDFNNNLLTRGGIEAYGDYNVKVTFEVNRWEAGSDKKGYITGDFTDDGADNTNETCG